MFRRDHAGCRTACQAGRGRARVDGERRVRDGPRVRRDPGRAPAPRDVPMERRPLVAGGLVGEPEP